MNEYQSKPSSSLGCIFLALLGGIAAVLLLISGPGMLVMAFLNSKYHLNFDTGQMWAFASAISVGLWMLICLLATGVRRGTMIYLAIAAFSLGAFWFCHFGLKSQITAAALALYFPESKTTAITDKAHTIHVSVNFDDVPAPQAFEYIYQASKRADPDGRGVRLIYTSKYNTPPPLISDRHQNIDIISLIGFFGPELKYTIRPDAIYFYPETETLE